MKARDVAQILDLEYSTVLDYFQWGDLPGYRLRGRKGGAVRFRPCEIQAWLESCRPTIVREDDGGAAAGRRPAPGNPNGGRSATPTLRVT